MSSLSDGVPSKRSRSLAWKYFRLKDKQSFLASCKICSKVLSYRTSVTNLLKHVRLQHRTVFTAIRSEEDSDDSETGDKSGSSVSENEDGEETNDDTTEENKKVKTESLETKSGEESVCLLCQKTFPDHQSDEMMKHMANVHNITEIKLVDGNIHIEQEETKPTKKTRRSRCWDYFSVIDRKSRIAVCNLCDRQLSYNTTVSNLAKHVLRKHHIVLNLRQNESVTETNGKEKKIYKPRSTVWTFFNYVNDKKTVCACVHCHKEFNVVEGLDNMRKHLMEKHPEALLHHTNNGDPLFITVTNDDNNDEESDEDNMQTEYLEIDDTDRQVKIKPTKRNDYFPQSTSFKGRPSLSERPSSERRSNKPTYRSPGRSQLELPDSLEYFSNYTMSLLQELPETISKKLQMNFVKQIIEAQISCAEETNRQREEGKKMSSPVDGMVDINDALVESGIVNEETTSSPNADVNNGLITIANGIIIRPIVTTS